MKNGIQFDKRIKSIDVVRGIPIFILLICENTWHWMRGGKQLSHSAWNGLTLADFGFPLFVTCLGVTIPISINNRLKKGDSTLRVFLNILRRSVILIILGLILNYWKTKTLVGLRYPGVLQRMAIVYFVTSLLYLLFKKIKISESRISWIFLAMAIAITIGYYLIAKPYGFDIEGNLAQKVDLFLFKGHLHTPTFDPDGFLTDIVSIASGMFGCTFGCIMYDKEFSDKKKILHMFVLGGLLFISSFIVDKYFFPFNKRLWSSSFVLIMAGIFGISLSVFYYICDIKNINKIFTPLRALTLSPILLYMVISFLNDYVWIKNVNYNGKNIWLCQEIVSKYFTSWSGELDIIVFTSAYVLAWVLVTMILYKKKIIIKI
ncbi:MAG: DUF5009 domain-containing protein [Clostridioides sp.]|jgi:predicted acyltransferase|nr:DUF5009 domain-containing protein [Clostridioides sp.]